MMLTSINRVLLALLILLSINAALISNASAQEAGGVIEIEDVQEVEGAAMIEMFDQTRSKPKILAAKRFHLKQTLNNEIRKIEAVCELDKKQKLKLRIGLKGAVKKLSEKWMKDNEGQLGFMLNGPVEIDENGEVIEREEKKEQEDQPVEIPTITDADEIDDMMMQMVVMQDSNPFRVSQPTNSKFWKKLVKETLREDQLAKLVEFRKQEEQRKLDIHLLGLMAALDRELTLTDQQEADLKKLIQPHVTNIKLQTATFYEPFLFNYHASKVSEVGLKAILTPNQIQQWKFFMAPAKQIGQMLAMENDMNFGGGDIVVEIANEAASELLEEVGQAVLDLFSK